VVFLFFVVVLPLDARAFGLHAHRALSERTLALEARDMPEVERYGHVLVAASVREDIDLFTKWARFNHYFDATGEARMRRASSNARVQALWRQTLEAAREGDVRRFYSRLGRALHHIQDMASPSHVAPIQHGLGDRFENVDIRLLLVDGVDIEDVVEPMEAPEAHEWLARDTWTVIQSGGLDVCGATIPWTAFWSSREGRFGRYGEAGNRFGIADEACEAEYRAAFQGFVVSRMAQAIHASRAVLVAAKEEWAARRASDSVSGTPR
jgi:hypothetical protein